MPERHSQLHLVSFADSNQRELGYALHDIVSANPHLADDFPALPDRYGSPRKGRSAVARMAIEAFRAQPE